MRHIIPISGKDSLATAIVQTTRDDKDYEFVFNPTGLELPEVFEWIKNVENYFGKEIKKIGKPLLPIITEKYNYFLPSQKSRYCTRESKIEPFVKWIGKDECMVYYGIRADEKRAGFNNQSTPNIIPVYTLQELGIDLKAVYTIVNNAGLKPPTFFWKSVYDEVVRIIGKDIVDSLPEWMFDMLFSWRSRTNCDRCYSQRYYEWVGLLEHHPDRFWDASDMEEKGSETFERSPKVIDPDQELLFSDKILTDMAKDEKKGLFTWSSNNKSLKQIYENRHYIKRQRVNNIIKAISKFRQLKIFEDESKEEITDVLNITSCGLFCGK